MTNDFMRISCFRAVFLLLSAFTFSHCIATTPSEPPYRFIWFPPDDTFRSWNWVESSGGNWNTMKIGPVDFRQKFPDEVKQWELGIVPVNDPARKINVPLGNPHAGNSVSCSGWMPGTMGDDVGQRLEKLGEGTFLCAILGDGHRYSNVSKVTIRHDYDPSREPVFRLTAVQPFGEDDPIRYIGVWIVAPCPIDPYFGTSATRCPAWEINGIWRIAPGDLGGATYPLPPGISWGETYDVGYRESFKEERFVEKGFLGNTGSVFTTVEGGYEPPISPFKEAKVRLRLADAIYNFDGVPLTDRQREYIKVSDMRPWQGDSKTAPLLKAYTSDVTDIRVDKDAIKRFDQAFSR